MSVELKKPSNIIVVSQKPDQWPALIDSLNGFRFWAYIFHENEPYISSDDKVISGDVKIGDIKPKHLHICIVDTPRTFKSWANRLEIPVQLIKSMKTGIKNNVLYLTHESPTAVRDGKMRYSRDLVVSNNVVKYNEYCTQGDVPNYKKELDDLLDYQMGKISLSEFLDSHPELLAVTPYQRLNVYRNLLTIKKY